MARNGRSSSSGTTGNETHSCTLLGCEGVEVPYKGSEIESPKSEWQASLASAGASINKLLK